jgi:hypothetical protein
MKSQYLPVDPDFTEQIEKTIPGNNPIHVHYFEKGNEVETVKGLAKKITSNKNGEFIVFESGQKIRLDRIPLFSTGIPVRLMTNMTATPWPALIVWVEWTENFSLDLRMSYFFKSFTLSK